jgi:hypothetical protein
MASCPLPKLSQPRDYFEKDMPSPSNEEMNSQLFNDLFDEMKNWDINIPDYYSGYCGGNGSHVKILLDIIKISQRDTKIDQILEK